MRCPTDQLACLHPAHGTLPARWVVQLAASVLVATLAGCVPIPTGFDSSVPGARIDASVRAANEQDAKAIPDLIALLDSEDPATRLIASNAIEWIIGRPIDFDHGGMWAERQAAIARLQEEYEQGRLVPDELAGPTEPEAGDDG